MYKLISEAEKEASKTCEYCGFKPATNVSNEGWIKTLCNNCNKKEK